MAKDTPNFIGNRIGNFCLVIAIITAEKVNFGFTKCDTLLGTDMGRSKAGSFRTTDIVGLDIGKHVAESTYETAKDDYEKQILAIPKYYYDMMDKGYLGNKAKRGFFMKDPKTKAFYEYEIKTGEYVPVVNERLMH
jgi:3-hydroxyacyl-CoA dehydrogenase